MGNNPIMVIIYFSFNKPYKSYWTKCKESRKMFKSIYCKLVRRVASDGSMSASGSAEEFDPRRGSKFSFENFQPWG